MLFWLYILGASLPWLAILCMLAWIGRVIAVVSYWPAPDPQQHILLREVLFHDDYYPTLFRLTEQSLFLALASLPFVPLVGIASFRSATQRQRLWILLVFVLGWITLGILIVFFPAWWES